jgi:hypothetical protein
MLVDYPPYHALNTIFSIKMGDGGLWWLSEKLPSDDFNLPLRILVQYIPC